MLKRNVRVPSQSVKSAAYKALVRPHLEYCSPVWDPSTKKSKDKIEMVQRRSARWVMGKYRQGPNTTGPTSMMIDLRWPLLQARRRVSRLCLMYKMANRFVLMSYCSLLIPYPYALKSLHPHAFIPLDRMPEKLYYSTSFFPCTVLEWNQLDASMFPQKPSPEVFKANLWGGEGTLSCPALFLTCTVLDFLHPFLSFSFFLSSFTFCLLYIVFT